MSLKKAYTSDRVSLAEAIRNGGRRFAQANTTYQTNVCFVNTYVNNVVSSSLPTVPVQPQDWQSYVTNWESANTVALQWVNTCMARLLDVPGDVQNYNATISALLTDAITQTNALIANPQNMAARSALDNDLKTLPQQLNVVETFIVGAIKALQSFQDNLPQLAQDLQQIADLAAKDNKADQGQIQNLQKSITQLQNDIDSLTAAIVGLAIADGAAVTLGLIASIAAFPVGLLSWFVLGPAVAVATTYIALDAKQIEADKTAIKAQQQQMSELTASCSVLQMLSSTYARFAAGTEDIQTTLSAVLAEWQTLSTDIGEAISDINSAISDEQADNYKAVLQDLQDARTEWSSAFNQAGSLALNIQVNNAQLQLGMSSADVKSALAAGKVQDVVSYFNSVGT